jgi:hypothetical protein
VFGGRFFGQRFFGERYFGHRGLVVLGRYFGGRNFGVRYFGPRYWGTKRISAFALAQTSGPSIAGVVGVAGDLSFPWPVAPSATLGLAGTVSVGAVLSFDNETDFAVTPPLEVAALSAAVTMGAASFSFGLPVPGTGCYYGSRYFGSRFFGSRYFGTRRQFALSVTAGPSMAGVAGVAGALALDLGVSPSTSIALSGTVTTEGDWREAAVIPPKRAVGTPAKKRRRNYIIDGKKYHNVTDEELAFLLSRDLIQREQVKVIYKDKKARPIGKEAFEAAKSKQNQDESDEIAALIALL